MFSQVSVTGGDGSGRVSGSSPVTGPVPIPARGGGWGWGGVEVFSARTGSNGQMFMLRVLVQSECEVVFRQLKTRMLISIVSRFICRCLSSLFKELWPFENRKMYRNVLKIHFSNGQNSLENVSISLKLSWQMLLWILWNSQKIDSRL